MAADGVRRGVSAVIGLQVVRDWVLRFNARGPDGPLDGKLPRFWIAAERCAGACLSQYCRAKFDYGDPRSDALATDRFGPLAPSQILRLARRTALSRVLNKLRYVKRTTRPLRHAQN